MIETFGWPHEPPTIVNWAGRPRNFVPLDRVLAGQVDQVRAVIAALAKTQQPLTVSESGRRIEAVPHVVDGHLHAVQYWSAPEHIPVPTRPVAGSWWIDLTDLTALGSDEWAEMANIPVEHRGRPRSLAAMFAQVNTDEREALAIKRIVQAAPGSTHQGIWTVSRGESSTTGTQLPPFRSHFSCRIYTSPTVAGDGVSVPHRIARGASQEVEPLGTGEPESGSKIVLLQHKILEATARPGQYRALINLSNLRLIRWVHGSPIPDTIAWMGATGEPAPEVHPDDHHVMIDMAKGLDTQSTHGTLRVRGLDGGWISIDASADLVALERDVTAAMVTFTLTP